MHIFKDIFYALGLTLFFGVIIGFIGVWIFDAEISTMIRVTVYIFILMLAISIYIDYDEFSVVISTTRSPNDISIYMNEDYQRALHLMKQINRARSAY